MNERADRAIAAVLDQGEQMSKEPLSDEEIERWTALLSIEPMSGWSDTLSRALVELRERRAQVKAAKRFSEASWSHGSLEAGDNEEPPNSFCIRFSPGELREWDDANIALRRALTPEGKDN